MSSKIEDIGPTYVHWNYIVIGALIGQPRVGMVTVKKEYLWSVGKKNQNANLIYIMSGLHYHIYK